MQTSPRMRIIRTKDPQDASRKTANIISAQVILKPDSVLGLATGSSPLGTYQQLHPDFTLAADGAALSCMD